MKMPAITSSLSPANNHRFIALNNNWEQLQKALKCKPSALIFGCGCTNNNNIIRPKGHGIIQYYK